MPSPAPINNQFNNEVLYLHDRVQLRNLHARQMYRGRGRAGGSPSFNSSTLRNFSAFSRSAIVNLDRVKELQPMFKGEHIIVLQDGKRLAMTRGLREVEQALEFG